MNKNKKFMIKWQEDTALERFRMIAPLLDESLDPAKRLELRRRIAATNDLSDKTIKRYYDAYKTGGFEGLKPQTHASHNRGTLPDNFEELLQEAIQLRREIPSRSVEKIIEILELEGRVAPGVLKRTTLQRHLYGAGFGSTHLKVLVQGDIKYGPYLPIGKNGAIVRTYLSSAIDDHSRLILSSRFYDNQDETIVEDTFRNVILKYGAFDKCYFDNGTQYVARQLRLSLAKLSIQVRYAPVRSGKSKGKIEKFHQVVDDFVSEAKVKKIDNLEELNHYWAIYLDEYYHKRHHEGIREYYESRGITLPPEGITPVQEFNRDTRPLNFIDTSVVTEAFLHHEKRKVDKGACISFGGRKYETKPSLIGYTVEIAYDPMAPEVITVSYPGMTSFTAHPLAIEEYCAQADALPASMLVANAETSRLLDALEKRHKESVERRTDAISFGGYRKEVTSNV